MENGGSRPSIADMRQSLFDEGILDSQFTVLEQLQDRDNPNFVEEVFTTYFDQSTELLSALGDEMKNVPTDFPKMDRILDRLNGSSACIGANRVRNEVKRTNRRVQQSNLDGTIDAFEDLIIEYCILKNRVRPYFQQLREASSAGRVPPSR